MKFKQFKAFAWGAFDVNEGFNHVDELQLALSNSMKDYHEAAEKLHTLQKRFIETPKENIRERESLKKALMEANREMVAKQSIFNSHLADNGDGDIFNDNSQQ